jgi:hypothetical protein
MIGPISVDGRTFIGFSADSLAEEQENYIFGHLRHAEAAVSRRDRECAKQTEKDPAEKLFTQILLSGRTHNVLAGILTEWGRVWNRSDADANALRFAAITDGEEKATMRRCIMVVLRAYCSPDEQGPAN